MDQCDVPMVLLSKSECMCELIQYVKIMNEAREVIAYLNHLETLKIHHFLF